MALVNGTEHTGRDYALGSQRTLAQPLPRLTPTPDLTPSSKDLERYEVVIIGAGPAGLFLTLLLSRYGLPSSSLLCIDCNSRATKTGHADGICTRTLEVLNSLGLCDEILRYACHIVEGATWTYNEAKGGIERTMMYGFNQGSGTVGDGIRCIHQGRVERILEDDLKLYNDRGVVRETECVDVRMDESEPEFPVVATLECQGVQRTVRTKYLVGADGGRSTVRRSLGIQMEGSMTDDVWGVVDLVVHSDYPDLRRQSNISSREGMILHIPRERKTNGDFITRLYVPFPPERADSTESVVAPNGEVAEDHEAKQRAHRATITLNRILAKAEAAFKPYHFKQKEGTDIEWWAVYQVGQRVASPFTVQDTKKHPRVFLVGDACHTHSPKIGQGLNVSMMDAFDLSWKLVHTLFGLTNNDTGLLETYAEERREHALNLIDMDKRWYNSRYGKIHSGNNQDPMSDAEYRAEVMRFVSGTAIEYEAGTMLIDDRVTADDAKSIARYSAGALREGRRIEDAVVSKFADSNDVHLHDELESDGRYSLIVWTGKDLLSPEGISQRVLKSLYEDILPTLPPSLVKVYVLHSLEPLSFEWADLPECVKLKSEMRLYRAGDDVYRKFDVDLRKGGIAVVRPDVYLGTIGSLSEDAAGVKKGGYLSEKVSLQLR